MKYEHQASHIRLGNVKKFIKCSRLDCGHRLKNFQNPEAKQHHTTKCARCTVFTDKGEYCGDLPLEGSVILSYTTKITQLPKQ